MALEVERRVDLPEDQFLEPAQGVGVGVRDSDDREVLVHPGGQPALVDAVVAADLGQDRAVARNCAGLLAASTARSRSTNWVRAAVVPYQACRSPWPRPCS